MEFSEIQKLVYEEYIKNGYVNMWTICPSNVYTKEQRLMDIAEVGLFNTEVSETMEAIRKFSYPMLLDEIGEELSDIVIRVLNFASRKGIQLEPYLIAKHEKNLQRGKNHGKEI